MKVCHYCNGYERNICENKSSKFYGRVMMPYSGCKVFRKIEACTLTMEDIADALKECVSKKELKEIK